MEHYYLSHYVIPFCIEDRYILFNARNQSLLQIPKSVYNKLNNNKDRNLQLEDFKFGEHVNDLFIKNKIFIIENEDKEYINEEVFKSQERSFASPTLDIVLAPTLDCNFACPYCFEKYKRKVEMGQDEIKQFIQFVEKYPKENFSITWYGGEPLLALETMYNIAKKLRNLKNKKWRGHSIITNGYLINDQAIDFFNDFDLKSIQITLDGDKSHHDMTRCDKYTHEGTFSHIIMNIGKLLEAISNLHISIRINIDRTNVQDYAKVIKLLNDNFYEYKQRLHPYPGFIRMEDKERRCWGCQTLSRTEIFRFYEELEEQGITHINWIPRHKEKGCTATSMHAYVIAPNGDIYKCWNDLGDPSRCCGNITDKAFKNSSLVRRYIIDGSGLNTDECKSCAFMPICSTGCAQERIENKYNHYNFNHCALCSDRSLLKKAIAHFIAGRPE